MIWMTWQQHRSQALIGAIALALLTLFLLLTGIHMAADYQPIVPCLAPAMLSNNKCFFVVNAFRTSYQGIDTMLMLLLMFIPLVVGILVGAPLIAREVEQKTHHFAWTQGITRQHWVLVKLSLILLAGALLEEAITSLWTWWHGPLAPVLHESPLNPVIFDTRGIVSIALVLFSLSLAVTMGALTRHIIPGIALTIVLYLVIVLSLMFLRTDFMYNGTIPATIVTWEGLTQVRPAVPDGAAQVGEGFMDHQQHVVSDMILDKKCNTEQQQQYEQCLHNHGWLRYFAYIPASWFWPLQIGEASLFLILSIVLITFTTRWARYHMS
jgi:ABC-type transport system involved in multi-copper enzyme maturation permease subunit